MTSSLFKSFHHWSKFFSNISYQRDLSLVLHSFLRRRYYPIPDDVWEKIAQMGGFLTRKEAGLLFWSASTYPIPGPVIELGSYEGRSTIIFALAGRHVYAVDAWADNTIFDPGIIASDVFRHFQSNLEQMQIEDMVTINRGLTHQVGKMWDIKCAILFIDAGHHYTAVKRDLDIWTPHLHERGLLIMHDVLGDTYFEVTRAASELLKSGWRVITSSGSAVAFSR